MRRDGDYMLWGRKLIRPLANDTIELCDECFLNFAGRNHGHVPGRSHNLVCRASWTVSPGCEMRQTGPESYINGRDGTAEYHRNFHDACTSGFWIKGPLLGIRVWFGRLAIGKRKSPTVWMGAEACQGQGMDI